MAAEGLLKKRESIVADRLGPLEVEIPEVGRDLPEVAQDDHPLGVEDGPLVDDLQGVSLLEELIGGVEKNQVEARLFLRQPDDRPVELLVDDPAAVLGLALSQVI